MRETAEQIEVARMLYALKERMLKTDNVEDFIRLQKEAIRIATPVPILSPDVRNKTAILGVIRIHINDATNKNYTDWKRFRSMASGIVTVLSMMYVEGPYHRFREIIVAD